MEFEVRLFLGDELLSPSDYDKVTISNVSIDRIVNHIYELAHAGDEENSA